MSAGQIKLSRSPPTNKNKARFRIVFRRLTFSTIEYSYLLTAISYLLIDCHSPWPPKTFPRPSVNRRPAGLVVRSRGGIHFHVHEHPLSPIFPILSPAPTRSGHPEPILACGSPRFRVIRWRLLLPIIRSLFHRLLETTAPEPSPCPKNPSPPQWKI